MEAPDPNEIAKLDYAAYSEEFLARLKFQESLAQTGFRTLTIINGGAIIALFTFVGKATPKAAIGMDSTRLWIAFACFVVGLISTTAAIFTGYFMQSKFGNVSVAQMWNAQENMRGKPDQYDLVTDMKHGNWWQIAAVALVCLGFVAFCVGSGFALAGVLPR